MTEQREFHRQAVEYLRTLQALEFRETEIDDAIWKRVQALAPKRGAVTPAASGVSSARRAFRDSAPSFSPSREVPQQTLLQRGGPQPSFESKKEFAPSEKSSELDHLREKAVLCQKCPHLVRSRTQVVFGVGNPNAEIMFVGEAPGEDEDKQGVPFVGAAGQLLTKMIAAMGLDRDTVYIANILKCRPDIPARAYGNRKPTASEMATCLPYLSAQIAIIRPKILVALGATAVEGLLGQSKVYITRLRGIWQDFRGIPLMPTFHPSYLLRNQAIAEKRKAWEDLLQVMEKADLLITEKQRGFFLKSKS